MVNITRNLAIDTLRSKGYRKQQQISADENSVSNYSDGTSKENLMQLVYPKPRQPKPEQRSIIDMAYFGGYTGGNFKETGVPLGTVKTRMRTAILELRKLVT